MAELNSQGVNSLDDIARKYDSFATPEVGESFAA